MVTLVYFGSDFSKSVGEPMLFWLPCEEPQWVDLDTLTATLDSGMPVTIRPATYVEYLQAESTVALARVELGAEQLRVEQLRVQQMRAAAEAAEVPGDVRH